MNEESTQQSTPVDTQETVDLNVNDLNNLRAIIDVAAGRGAFKPGEMAAIGAVYNKLAGFLDKVTATQEQVQNG